MLRNVLMANLNEHGISVKFIFTLGKTASESH